MPPKQKQTPTPSRSRSQISPTPFPHLTITNFLSPALYKKTVQIYSKLQFKNKTSDLFNFFQTDQLNAYEKLDYFRDQLHGEFMRLPPFCSPQSKVDPEKIFYNIFASYYFEGNYLLCHDDIVEDRVYAFSYYLEDHDSGDLVLFNSTADKEVKRIKVRKNTLAIFEVSDISYHEVDYTKVDGRKAITGWINIKGLGKTRKEKTIPAYVPQIPKGKVIEYPLAPEYVSEQYFQLMDIQYQFNIKKTRLQGPFYSRKVHKIEIDPPVLFTVPGHTLLSAQFYNFQQGDYILLNDPVNKIKGKDIIDIFVTHLPEGFVHSEEGGDEDEDQDEEGDMLIKIVQKDEEASGIPEVHDSLFVVRRGKKQYYVDRCKPGKGFMLGHFIYVKDESKKEKKTKATKESKVVKKETKAKKTTKANPKTKKPLAKPAVRKSPALAQKSTNTRKIKKQSK